MTGWVPDADSVVALHRRYAPSEQVLDLVLTHCRIVADVAQWCADRLAGDAVDHVVLRAAALLHDVGAYALFDPTGVLPNPGSYAQHALLGATLLRDDGVDDRVCGAVETHVLMGLSRAEIVGAEAEAGEPSASGADAVGEAGGPGEGVAVGGWRLPHRDYRPRSPEARLLCYADRFHSKRPCFNAPATLAATFRSRMPQQATLFEQSMERYGVPDVEALAALWGHPVV